MDFFDFGGPHDVYSTNCDINHSVHDSDFLAFANGTTDFTHAAGHEDLPPSQSQTLSFKPDGSFVEPQLTPDGRDSHTYTNSSVLTGHNPEYAMSPLQISTRPGQNIRQTRKAVDDIASFNEDEEFFSPLESPAIPPTYDMPRLRRKDGMINAGFSPLTSPALNAQQQQQHHSLDPHFNQTSTPENILQQKLAMIEQQQQQLRTAHRQMQEQHTSITTTTAIETTDTMTTATSSSSSSMDTNNNNNMHHQQQQPVAPSPHLHPYASASTSDATTSFSRPLAPATPSLLMKLGGGGGSMPAQLQQHQHQYQLQQEHQKQHRQSYSHVVDNMPSLPAAMLEDKQPQAAMSKSKTSSNKRRKTTRVSAAFTSPGLTPTAHMSPRPHATDPTIAALVSPAALRPQPIASSPRALKPLISPSLQPNGKRLSAMEEQVAAAELATKSNYQNMREGKAKSLGIDFSSSFQSGVENRRSAHKAAEQKRRDTLKQSFDSLRQELADALIDTDIEEGPARRALREEKEKEVKQMSKVLLIQHSYEYILRLKNQNRHKDDEMEKLRNEVCCLRKQLQDVPASTSGKEPHASH
ncbi:hypothetical protein BCR43DRAFT_517086 [Syncephalastrum racemosum]|uniref:BHLH domain-containing protein n=1 Tax=Syncephalastrum racemosum TaxID=13706 RepID=A0A1X2H6I0_SYNRA|nr:hypothetical protein BCR43DRAFT_517086 [Syncephalastrum racemosum]